MSSLHLFECLDKSMGYIIIHLYILLIMMEEHKQIFDDHDYVLNTSHYLSHPT